MPTVVLIVDDHPTDLFLLERAVKKSKISDKPLCFSGGAGLLEYFEQHDSAENIYLILLDINMPSVDGWELMEILKQKPYSSRLFFLLVTSSVDESDRDKISGYGNVISFLEKPIYRQVLEALQELDPFRIAQ